MKIDSRRIIHVNATSNPSLHWVKQQIREVTPWGPVPSFLVHDNDGIFGQYGKRVTVERSGKSYYNGARPSQAIHGIPDPYPELRQPPPPAGKLVVLPVLGGVQHDYRLVA